MRLYRAYCHVALFVFVYIQEAEAVAQWQYPSEDRMSSLRAPRTLIERQIRALHCRNAFGVEFPAAVDTIDNGTERAYTAWPSRLYVIDDRGKVAFKGGSGGVDRAQSKELAGALVDLFPQVPPPRARGAERADESLTGPEPR